MGTTLLRGSGRARTSSVYSRTATCSQITAPQTGYFNAQGEVVNPRVLDSWLNYAAILYLPLSIPTAYLLTTNGGLRHTIFVGGTAIFASCLLRVVPTVTSVGPHWVQVILSTAQILNAATTPMVMSTPSQISAMYFDASERGVATAIAAMSNSAGVTIGFLSGPAFVKVASDIPGYLRAISCVGV